MIAIIGIPSNSLAVTKTMNWLTSILVPLTQSQFTGDFLGGCYSALSTTSLDQYPASTSVCLYLTPTEDITTVSATTVLTTLPKPLSSVLKTVPSPVWLVTRVVSVTEVQKIEPTVSTYKFINPKSSFAYVPAVVLIHAPSDVPNAGNRFADARPSVYISLLSMTFILLLLAALV
jgi:hypothetical protein